MAFVLSVSNKQYKGDIFSCSYWRMAVFFNATGFGFFCPYPVPSHYFRLQHLHGLLPMHLLPYKCATQPVPNSIPAAGYKKKTLP
jgi:hypothetical protein